LIGRGTTMPLLHRTLSVHPRSTSTPTTHFMNKSICARGIGGLARQARRRIDAYRHLALRVPGRLSEAAEEHVGILDAIVAGDGPTAQRLMVSHADIQKNDFAQYISIIEAAESRP